MKYNGVISAKFSILDNEIIRLRGLGKISCQQLEADHFLKHGIERSLQICVEIVIDVAQRILSLEGHAPAPSSFEAMKSLEAMRLIRSADPYRTMIQFRNFVVHRYERVDSSVLVNVLEKHLDDLVDFKNEVMGVA